MCPGGTFYAVWKDNETGVAKTKAADFSEQDSTLYTIQGQKISGKKRPVPGLYIKNSRKFILK